MYKAVVNVRYVQSVVNPDEEVLKGAIEKLEINSISSTQIGHTYEFTLQEDSKDKAEETMNRLINKLLINPSMETYTLTVEEA